MAQLTELKPTRTRQPAMIKAGSGGLAEKAVVVGGGVAIAYTFAATLPLASIAAVVAIGAYLWDEAANFRTKDNLEEVNNILTAKTPKHPSIQELRSQLKATYPTEAINQAIESMIGHCEWVEFSSKDKHPLAPFGRVFCWVDPSDSKNAMLPLQRLEELFKQWDILPTVEATATPAHPHQGAELASQPPALPQGTQEASQSLAAKELLHRLKAEAPELLKLVKAPPIRLVGLQRTGKSTFAQRLALLRMVLLPGHSAAWATPHRELDNPVPAALNPTGYTATGAKDYPAIEALWTSTQSRIDQGQSLNQTVVWDEFGGYDQFSDPELLKGSLRSLLREATKFGYHPILIAHGDQASFYPGVSNILTTIKQSTVKVETIGAVADHFGTMRPTGKVTITWLDSTTTELTWPAWLTTDYLLSCLQEPPGTQPGIHPGPPVAVASNVDMEAYGASECSPDEPTADDENTRRVGAKLAAKLEEAQGEWVTIRDLTINLFRQPQDRELATQLIRDLINEYRLESIDKLNPNKTITVFVRLKPTDPPANNSLN
ncbi:MAG: hypothetical protein LVS60_05435 [Nodosilinea sp. LVE1205-7]